MYNSYFGFPESPFNVTPDPRFFYINPVYQEAFAALRYGIEAKKGFIVITGEVGTGKTTLLRKLMRNLGDTIHSVFIFNTLLSFPELLQFILHDLGLASTESNKVTMLQQLNQYLITQLKQGHVVSVLIDEAQDLSDEALEGLRLLSNLETDQEKLLQIVLMGQPELKIKLDQPGLRQLKHRVAVQCQLAPLQKEETGPYIDFRLRTSGYTGKDLFQPDAVQQIAFYSQGIPRLINIVCDNALLGAFAESKKSVSAEMVRDVGRDLRLGPEIEFTAAATAASQVLSKSGQESAAPEAPCQLPPRTRRSVFKAGVATALVGIAILALASMVDPQTFFRMAATRLETSKQNLSHWFAFAMDSEAVAEDVAVEPEKVAATVQEDIATARELQRIRIQHGSTISEIVSDAYGANNFLAWDIIKEFNPQIKNLNRVFFGQELLLPPLTRETMLREQPDGSYRLILSSFSSQTEADQYAGLLGNAGYQVLITPNRVSDDLLLHRVEIDGLKNSQEANAFWDRG